MTESTNCHKEYEVWPKGECPHCGETYTFKFERIEERVGRRTCTTCGYFEEYKMSPIVEPKEEKSLPWPRYDPIEYTFLKMRGFSDDEIDYGDYIESW